MVNSKCLYQLYRVCTAVYNIYVIINMLCSSCIIILSYTFNIIFIHIIVHHSYNQTPKVYIVIRYVLHCFKCFNRYNVWNLLQAIIVIYHFNNADFRLYCVVPVVVYGIYSIPSKVLTILVFYCSSKNNIVIIYYT